MSYKVTAALVIIPNDDTVSGDGYFYKDAIVPDGWNDERCKQLATEGMLEKVKADKSDADSSSSSESSTEPSVKDILTEVGEDKEKAQAALEAEREARGDKARKTLVEPLEKLLAD